MQIKTEDNLIFEIVAVKPDTYRGNSKDDTPPIAVSKKFEDTLSFLKPIADAVKKQVSDMPFLPEEITMELAIKINADLDAVIVKLGSEANIKINLKWNPSNSTQAKSRKLDTYS
jgi:hypothetical protein